MSKRTFRDFLGALEEASELCHVPRPVDVRDLSGLAGQSRQALLFERIEGYGKDRVRLEDYR